MEPVLWRQSRNADSDKRKILLFSESFISIFAERKHPAVLHGVHHWKELGKCKLCLAQATFNLKTYLQFSFKLLRNSNTVYTDLRYHRQFHGTLRDREEKQWLPLWRDASTRSCIAICERWDIISYHHNINDIILRRKVPIYWISSSPPNSEKLEKARSSKKHKNIENWKQKNRTNRDR